MTDIIAIAINKLDADPKNVRKSYSAGGICELAASIEANGVVQNLVVRKGEKKGRYFVTAGGRRLAALTLLAKEKRIEAGYTVNCAVREADEATEISLTENCMREAMTAADQFVAFSALANEGKSVADIAARFGTTETIVKKRLLLARVSPVLLDLFRNEDMRLDQLSAFTVTDDHEAQERVWNALPSYNRHPGTIRHALTEGAIRGTDKRITFIGGLDAYEKAGGAVRRDLFDEDGGGIALDPVKLDQLVADRLEAVAAEVRVEGWKWVEVMPVSDYQYLQGFSRVYPETLPVTAEEQAELLRVMEEYDALAELIEAGAADEGAEDRLAALQQRADEIDTPKEIYTAEDIAMGGAVVSMGYRGEVSIIERGLVRVEDMEGYGPEESAGDGDAVEIASDESGDSEAAETGPVHSATLIEDLTAQKTAALRVELANNPDIALAAVVYAMLLCVTGSGWSRAQSALQISLTSERLETSLKQAAANRAMAELESLRENYGRQIPGNPADLWDWCLEQPQDRLLSLLAYAAAQTVNAVETKHSGDRKSAFAHADQLGRALKVDMGQWFEPTGDNYFSHLNRKGIEAVVCEVRGEDSVSAVRNAGKKTEAVTIAERMIAGSGWLPAPVRIEPPKAGAEIEADTDTGNCEIHPFAVAAE